MIEVADYTDALITKPGLEPDVWINQTTSGRTRRPKREACDMARWKTRNEREKWMKKRKGHTPQVQTNQQGTKKNLPMTVYFLPIFIFAVPMSPILTSPCAPLIKMLSHLMSRWMIGGSYECRYISPFRICRHHRLITLRLGDCNLRIYLIGRGKHKASQNVV